MASHNPYSRRGDEAYDTWRPSRDDRQRDPRDRDRDRGRERGRDREKPSGPPEMSRDPPRDSSKPGMTPTGPRAEQVASSGMSSSTAAALTMTARLVRTNMHSQLARVLSTRTRSLRMSCATG